MLYSWSTQRREWKNGNVFLQLHHTPEKATENFIIYQEKSSNYQWQGWKNSVLSLPEKTRKGLLSHLIWGEGVIRSYFTRYSPSSGRGESKLATPITRTNKNAELTAASAFSLLFKISDMNWRIVVFYQKLLTGHINYTERVDRRDSKLARELQEKLNQFQLHSLVRLY